MGLSFEHRGLLPSLAKGTTWLTCAFCMLGTNAAHAEKRTEVLELERRSVSASRQFIVYGADKTIRQQVASDSEPVKQEVLQTLRLRDLWKVPVVVMLGPQPLGSVRRNSLQIFATGSGVKLQMDLWHSGGVFKDFFREITRAVLIEIMYRNKEVVLVGAREILPPEWLVEGLEGIHGLRNNVNNADVYEALLKSGNVPDLDEFLRRDPGEMDSTSRGIYQLYATALLRSLLELGEGPAGIVAYLEALPDGDVRSAEGLRTRFPTMAASPAALSKRWTLAVARLSASARYQFRTVEQTEDQISKALEISLPSGEEGAEALVPLSDFADHLKDPVFLAQLSRVSEKLIEISPQANPVLLPVLSGYHEAIARLLRNKPKGVAAEITLLAERRRVEVERADAIADTLNWIEASQTGQKSGLFDSYVEAAGDLNKPKPKHQDAISRYLDVLEFEIK